MARIYDYVNEPRTYLLTYCTGEYIKYDLFGSTQVGQITGITEHAVSLIHKDGTTETMAPEDIKLVLDPPSSTSTPPLPPTQPKEKTLGFVLRTLGFVPVNLTGSRNSVLPTSGGVFGMSGDASNNPVMPTYIGEIPQYHVVPGGVVSGGAVPGGAVPGRVVPGGAVPGGAAPGGAMPGGAAPGTLVPGGVVDASGNITNAPTWTVGSPEYMAHWENIFGRPWADRGTF